MLDLLEQIGGWPAILYNIPDYKGSFQKNLQLVHALGGDAFFKWNVHKPQEQSPLPPDQPFIVVYCLLNAELNFRYFNDRVI